MARSRPRLLFLLLAALTAGLAQSAAQEAPPAPEIVPVSGSVPAVPSSLAAVPSAPSPGPTTPAGGASISVETIGPLTVPSGQPLPFEIVVRNAWVLSATQVRVELPIPSGARFLAGAPAPTVQGDRVVWTIGNLETGGEQRFKGEMQPGGDGDLVLSPSVSYSSVGSLRARIVRPAFSVSLTGPETLQRGQKTGFRLDVANSSADRLTDIVGRIKLPEGFRHPAGTEIEADVGELAAGQTRRLNLEVTADKTGQFVLEASAQAHTGQLAQGRAVVSVGENAVAMRVEAPSKGNTSHVEAPSVSNISRVEAPSVSNISRVEANASVPEAPELELEIFATGQVLELGGETNLELRVRNKGTGAATNVRLGAELPAGLLPVGAEGPTQVRIDGQRVSFGSVKELTSRGEALYRVRVRGAQPGHMKVVTELNADALGQPIVEPWTTQVLP